MSKLKEMLFLHRDIFSKLISGSPLPFIVGKCTINIFIIKTVKIVSSGEFNTQLLLTNSLGDT